MEKSKAKMEITNSLEKIDLSQNLSPKCTKSIHFASKNPSFLLKLIQIRYKLKISVRIVIK
uniref:Uncharacterized protein n=1 Tax=Rhizophora mucronata TaxID=61149 RepID=A0A2P2JST4_RHIMU